MAEAKKLLLGNGNPPAQPPAKELLEKRRTNAQAVLFPELAGNQNLLGFLREGNIIMSGDNFLRVNQTRDGHYNIVAGRYVTDTHVETRYYVFDDPKKQQMFDEQINGNASTPVSITCAPHPELSKTVGVPAEDAEKKLCLRVKIPATFLQLAGKDEYTMLSRMFHTLIDQLANGPNEKDAVIEVPFEGYGNNALLYQYLAKLRVSATFSQDLENKNK